MVRKYSRSKHKVSSKVRRTKRKVRRTTRRTKRRTTRRKQRGGFTTAEIVRAAAIGLGLSAFGYEVYKKRKSDKAIMNRSIAASTADASFRIHMDAADDNIYNSK